METAYRMHRMDLTSYRLVPELLGTEVRDCEHLACEMVLLNAFAAGHLVERGLSCDHSTERARRMLMEAPGTLWH